MAQMVLPQLKLCKSQQNHGLHSVQMNLKLWCDFYLYLFTISRMNYSEMLVSGCGLILVYVRVHARLPVLHIQCSNMWPQWSPKIDV